ncbi:hypothetical protein DRP04_15000 [Archaeoglobales archaeon]|nr:MAG: hypothetical protein DRP04_15000 [Archaeoglobales archaeon]
MEKEGSPTAKLLLMGKGCNNNCLYCPYQGQAFESDPYRLINAIRNKEKGEEQIILAGREPPIHPYFIDLVKEANQAGYKIIEVLTNGRIFSIKRFTRRAILAGLTDIEVKFFSVDPAIHDSITRVPGSWKQTVKGIKNILYFQETYIPYFRPSLCVGIYVGRRNYQLLQQTLDFLEDRGVREVFLIKAEDVKLGEVKFKGDLFTVGFGFKKYGENGRKIIRLNL